jgi:hypothetical protein
MKKSVKKNKYFLAAHPNQYPRPYYLTNSNRVGSGGPAARAVCLYQFASRLREFPGERADGTNTKGDCL